MRGGYKQKRRSLALTPLLLPSGQLAKERWEWKHDATALALSRAVGYKGEQPVQRVEFLHLKLSAP